MLPLDTDYKHFDSDILFNRPLHSVGIVTQIDSTFTFFKLAYDRDEWESSRCLGNVETF